MAKNEKKDWSQEVSGQIAVCKTDKTLLELWNSLKPASDLFPAHIHAAGEKAEAGARSLIRLNMLDYSNGTGDNSVSVYANISPEEAKYIYSVLFSHLAEFTFQQDKIFGEPDEHGYSIVTRLQIIRHGLDQQGRVRNYPWYVEIQNGAGIAARNANGGRYCQKGSYIVQKVVRMFLSDRDMFVMFARADAFIRAFEMEHAFRQSRAGNFNTLYRLLNQRVQEVGDLVQFYGEGGEALPKAG